MLRRNAVIKRMKDKYTKEECEDKDEGKILRMIMVRIVEG